MKQQSTKLDGFQMIGIKTRTTNAEEMKGAGRIQALWAQFYSEQTMAQIPEKMDAKIISAYHDYESDANGAYSVLIGVKVAPGTHAPEGMHIVNVPAQSYSQLTSRQGEMPGVVIEMWQKVWQLESKSELKRKYSVDLEVYDERSMNPANAVVELFIATK
ncbi:MAG: AraC family transcriptional regulator [Bdellovibrio sp.]|nr:AraC family transcriptional regulator [Bdellovibrio sp.]